MLPQLKARFENIAINRSMIFSDMTGTILRQTPDGSKFPVSSRNALSLYIEKGGIFVLVTGDSFPVACHQFTAYLPTLKQSYFVITEAGAEIYRVTNGIFEKIYSAIPLSEQCRRTALEVCIQTINNTFNIRCEEYIQNSEYGSIETFLQGGRIEIKPLSSLTNGSFFLEAADFKITVFAEGGDIKGSQADFLLETLLKDRMLVGLAESNEAFLMKGAIYFEIIKNSKEQGIKTLFDTNTPELLHLSETSEQTFVYTLGDSPNDEGMFLFPFNTRLKNVLHTSVFMGIEEKFIQALHLRAEFQAKNFFHLSGSHETGTSDVLRSITAEGNVNQSALLGKSNSLT